MISTLLVIARDWLLRHHPTPYASTELGSRADVISCDVIIIFGFPHIHRCAKNYEVEKISISAERRGRAAERPIRDSVRLYGSTCADMQQLKSHRVAASAEKWRIINLLDDMWMLLPEVESLGSWRKVAVSVAAEFGIAHSIVYDFGDNFKLQEQLSGGSVVVDHEEPHPQMTGTLSLQARRKRGRQWEKSSDTQTQATDEYFTVARRLHGGGGVFARRPYGVYL
ncbi:hypothetical protein TNCV_3408821 [Trichonephila clavipes]|nr:hypothetical protein TNCV_3408821 [Trichonephila clavipes]